MNPVIMETVDKKPDKTRGKPYHAIANWYFALSAKRTGKQRRAKTSP